MIKLKQSGIIRIFRSHCYVINGQELYRLIFERIPSTAPICGSISQGVEDPSVWDDECGHHSESLPAYVTGREMLIKKFGFDI